MMPPRWLKHTQISLWKTSPGGKKSHGHGRLHSSHAPQLPGNPPPPHIGFICLVVGFTNSLEKNMIFPHGGTGCGSQQMWNTAQDSGESSSKFYLLESIQTHLKQHRGKTHQTTVTTAFVQSDLNLSSSLQLSICPHVCRYKHRAEPSSHPAGSQLSSLARRVPTEGLKT